MAAGTKLFLCLFVLQLGIVNLAQRREPETQYALGRNCPLLSCRIAVRSWVTYWTAGVAELFL